MPDGFRIVLGSGEIVSGDGQRLQTALKFVRRDPFGNKNLALNSPGGAVSAAFEMVAVLDSERVTTIVPLGASCASACAQIVFVSGVHHVVLEGGRLGIHTCSHSATNVPSDFCNERIAMNAVAHGVAHGTLMAFMRYTPANEMIWFDAARVDCWGLSRWPPGLGKDRAPGDFGPCVEEALRRAMGQGRNEKPSPPTVSAAKPSFDCSKATTGLEKAFCADPRLASLDAEMGAAYRRKLQSLLAHEITLLQREQLQWLRQRAAACGLPATASMEQWLRPDAKKCAADVTVVRTRQLQ
jgi:uncharacterized protein YecT (DUF1311 family)